MKSPEQPVALRASHASLIAIAVACCYVSPALAQSTGSVAGPLPQAADSPKIQTLPPKGFEGLDDAVSTEFDVTFQQQVIGSFRATYKDGALTFADPAAVAQALGPLIDTAAVTALLSKPLSGNEQYRCRPGQVLGVGCGILPSGMSGVIVNADSFSISLFLAREYLISTISGPRMLGEPMSGPSLIQTIRFAASKEAQGGISYGGTFDTLASVGRTSFVAQTTVSNFEGFRTQQAYVQRIWSDRRAAVGLLQDFQSLVFTNYRLGGAEFGSFYGTLLDATNDTATPLEVVLPQRAQVEIYRDNVLITAARYDAGLQLLNTVALPEGSYTVRIVARDGGRVLLDQTRSFSKIGNLVPPGKTAFRFRAGERVQDNFLDPLGTGRVGFIPKFTGEFVASASAQRRLGNSMAGSLSVTSFNSRAYGEASLQLFSGRVSGLVGGGIGSNGAYSGLVSANFQFPRISFNLSARTTHGGATAATLATDDRYQPFFRNQDTLFGSIQTRLMGGSLGLTGSYSRSSDFPRRYAVGVQYSRTVDLPWTGAALLTAGVTKSDFDTRIGISISFFKRVDRKTMLSVTAGGQYVPTADPALGARTGFSPVGEAVLSRSEQVGPVDLVGEAGAGTDADGDRAFARLRAQSPYGSGDASVQWQDRRFGTGNVSYLANGQTGFAIGGGAVKLGMRNPAESMVVLDLTNVRVQPQDVDTTAPADGGTGAAAGGSASASAGPPPEPKVAEGGYRITIDGRAYDYIEPGRRVALGLPALKEYSIGLKPEGAPQFDIDGTRRTVTLYPGNVVRLRFEAQRVVSLFGQALNADGTPLAGARVEAGTDYAIADDRGYFTVTAPLAATMSIRTATGAACLSRPITSVVDAKDPALLYRFGTLRCGQPSSGDAPVAPAPVTGPAASSAAPAPEPEPAAASPAKTSATDSSAKLQPAAYGSLPAFVERLAPPLRTDCSKAGKLVEQRRCETLATQRANTEELARVSNRARSLVDNLSGSGPVALADAESSLAILVAQSFLRQAALDEIPGDVPLY